MYTSQSLTELERCYLQTKHEALAVVWGFERFKFFLLAVNFELTTVFLCDKIQERN